MTVAELRKSPPLYFLKGSLVCTTSRCSIKHKTWKYISVVIVTWDGVTGREKKALVCSRMA